MLMFVYGTLKANFSAHKLMGNSEFLGCVKTESSYALYDVGGFPGMMPTGEADGVIGELYECSPEVIKNLDRYECVDSFLFERREIELKNGVKAEAYIYLNNYNGKSILIEEGVWAQ